MSIRTCVQVATPYGTVLILKATVRCFVFGSLLLFVISHLKGHLISDLLFIGRRKGSSSTKEPHVCFS